MDLAAVSIFHLACWGLANLLSSIAGLSPPLGFHGDAAADSALNAFINRFRNKEIPDDMPEVVLDCNEAGLGVAHVLQQAKLVASTSEAFRMIKQGAVRIDGERISDKGLELPVGSSSVCQVGKRRFARVILK